MVEYAFIAEYPPAMQPQPLIVAVPNLNSYHPHTGLGRVFQSLRANWGAQVDLVDTTFATANLPVLRNFPVGISAPTEADLVLLPQLTGAQSLRHTRGVPGVVIVHDIGIVDFPGDQAGMNWLTHQTILHSFWGLQHARQIVTVSHFCRERLLTYMPDLAERVCVVPNGVDELFLNHRRTRAAARQRVAQRLGRTLSEPLLVNVGSEIPRKNMPLLLDVFKQISAAYPGAQLLKVGGPGQPRWRTRTLRVAHKLGLQVGRELLFLEQVDDALLADIYRAADLFVSTSLYEGFGLPALEAMAVGTPVVVTDRGAFPECVGNVGWVVPPEPEPFVQAIHTALADPLREERYVKGRIRASMFTWSRAAEQYVDLMREVCGHPKASEGLFQ